jgi:hypothetical protein
MPRDAPDPAPLGVDLRRVPTMGLDEEEPVDRDLSGAAFVEGPGGPRYHPDDIVLSKGRVLRMPRCDWYVPRVYKVPGGSVFYGRWGSEGLLPFEYFRRGRPGRHRARLAELDYKDLEQLCRAEGIPIRFLAEWGAVGVVPPQGPLADSSPGGPATAGAARGAKGTSKRPGRRRKTELTDREQEVWTLYEKHRGEPSLHYEIVSILRSRFPGLTRALVESIVRKIKARQSRASRKPASRGR